jgi:hypothetical protein
MPAKFDIIWFLLKIQKKTASLEKPLKNMRLTAELEKAKSNIPEYDQ